MQHRPWNKCGNAGRIAQWILGNIEDPLDYWQHGNGVTSAGSEVKLAIGDTVVTLENKWWGVRGFACRGYKLNSLERLWNLKYLWAPEWLHGRFSWRWGAKVLAIKFAGLNPFWWSEDHASQRLRAAMPHKVY